MCCISCRNLHEKFNGICDFHRIAAVTPDEQFCIIKVIEILQSISRTEFNAADFLQVDKVNLLRASRLAAKFKTLKGFPDRCLQFPVKHGRCGGKVYLIASLFCAVIHNAAAVHQNHHLIRANFNPGTVGNDVRCSLPVASPLSPCNLYALGQNRSRAHVSCCNILQPGISQRTADCPCCCTNNTHSLCTS